MFEGDAWIVFGVPLSSMKINTSFWVQSGRWLVLLAWATWGVALVFGSCLLADVSISGALSEEQIFKIVILSALASWLFIKGAAWIAPTRKVTVAVVLLLFLMSAAAYSTVLRWVAVVSISALTQLAYPEAKDVLGPLVLWMGVGVGGVLAVWVKSL